MNRDRRRGAFTLIEVLIVVVIMAVLAAIVIPRVSVPIEDAKTSTLKHNMHALRSQIELYNAAHLGAYPAIQNNDLPQLTKATNTNGVVGPSGPGFPYGPYVTQELPQNPFDDSNAVTPVATAGEAPTAVSGALGGWQYDEQTGDIWPNNPGYFQ